MKGFRIRCVISLAASALMMVEGVLFLGSQMDDPYIFARYAENFWRYGDVIWNPAEPRIEGFSSWLWLLIYVGGVRLLADPVVVARIVGVVAAGALVASFAWVVLNERFDYRAGVAALVVLIASPALAFYAGCGMDHIVWALVVWLYILWVGHANPVAARHFVVGGLGILVRPEGFLLFAPSLALLWASSRRDPGESSPRLASLTAVGAGVLTLGLLVLVRYALFAAWLPNAAAAKHAGGSIFLRLLDGAIYLSPGVAAYLAIPAIALAFGATRERDLVRQLADGATAEDRVTLAALAFAVGLVAFTLLAGGDDVAAFGPMRLLVPAFAPAAFVLFWALHATSLNWGRTGRVVLVVLLSLAVRATSSRDLLREATGSTNLSGTQQILLAWRDSLEPRALTPISDYLLRNTPPGEYIAVPWVGLVAYQTRLPVIDLLGLNDRTIARSSTRGRGVSSRRYNAAYVLDRRPYFICENFVVRAPLDAVAGLSDPELRALGAFKPGQRDLLRDPRLAIHYDLALEAPVASTCFRRKIRSCCDENGSATLPTFPTTFSTGAAVRPASN